MTDSQIPFSCKRAELEDLSEELSAKIRAAISDKRGALLYGPTGLGKTYAMMAAMRAIERALPARRFGPNVILDEERNTVCSFVDWPEFVANLEDEHDLGHRLFSWRGPLFVDDVGQEHAPLSGYLAGKPESVFDQFVNRRTGMDLPLWITSNLTLNELRDRYGERVMSRLTGHCALIRFEGSDRRLAS